MHLHRAPTRSCKEKADVGLGQYFPPGSTGVGLDLGEVDLVAAISFGGELWPGEDGALKARFLLTVYP